MPAMLRKLAQRLGLTAGGFPGGIHPDPNKLTAGMAIEECALAPMHVLPMKQHIGETCSPIVEVGDRVLRGQKIAKSEGYVSVPIHAPTSGRVVRIAEHHVPHPSGMGMPSIIIESDGEDESDESLEPIADWKNTDPTVLRERARVCGLAGLGGAVFPTFIKLVRDKRFQIETVILNGVECEPYLTNDHRLMLEHTDEILSGMNIMMHMVSAKNGIIAVEDNKPDAVAAMRAALSQQSGMENVRVAVLPTRYPQGSEKQLISTLTGKEVPAGLLPMHVGVLCHNVGTSKALHDAILRGRPLTERIVTISGDAVPQPGNVRVRLGTPMRFVLNERGLSDFEQVRILLGGPMMGERLPHPDVPVIKASTGMLALRLESFAKLHAVEQPCIRCGRCSEVCPTRLVPNMLADFCRSNQFEKAEHFQLFDCIECGSCSYVCPARVPLVHYFRYGKGQLAQQRREQEFAELSRMRSAAREARLAKEAEEKAAKRAAMRSKKPAAKPAAKAEGAAAAESAAKAGAKPVDTVAVNDKVAAAKARRAARMAAKGKDGDSATEKPTQDETGKSAGLNDKIAAAKARRAARAAAKAGGEAEESAASAATEEVTADKKDDVAAKVTAAKARRAARAAAKAGGEAEESAASTATEEVTAGKKDDVAAKVAAAKARRAARAAAKAGGETEETTEPSAAEAAAADKKDDVAAKVAAAKARRAARAAAKAGGKKEKLESDA